MRRRDRIFTFGGGLIARPLAGPAADGIRSGRQSQDRKGARPYRFILADGDG
jgi:hypothetical protein